MALARQVGFANISLDLIFGLPGETPDDWRQTLRWATALQPDHLSCYGLQVEGGTPLYAMVQEGRVRLPTEDEVSAMFLTNTQLLPAAGYDQYEISNFARRPKGDEATGGNYQCRHNLIYWRYQDYLGLSVAAASTLAGHRWANHCNLEEYISALRRRDGTAGAYGNPHAPAGDGGDVDAGVSSYRRSGSGGFRKALGCQLRRGFGRTGQSFVGRRFSPENSGYLPINPSGMLVSNQVLTQLLLPLL